MATEALELEQSGLGYQRVPPGYRFPYGHTHKKQEEVYVVVHGSGRMKLDDEIVELKEWDVVRVRPVRGEATRPGRRASRSSSSARLTLARLRAKTSRASATGGLTNSNSALRQPLWTRSGSSQRGRVPRSRSPPLPELEAMGDLAQGTSARAGVRQEVVRSGKQAINVAFVSLVSYAHPRCWTAPNSADPAEITARTAASTAPAYARWCSGRG